MKKWSKTQWTGTVLSCILMGLILFVMLILAWPDTKEKDPYKLIFIPKTIDPTNGFWTSLIEGAKLGASELGA